jgi:hypothetical protein
MRRVASSLFIGSILLVVAGCTKSGSDTEPLDSDPQDSIIDGIDTDGDGSPDDEDCDPNDATVYPGASEVCDGIDNNCDGVADEGVMETFYADSDEDGFGDVSSSEEACERPDGYVPADAGEDCDDTDASIYPGAPELCDEIDNDCNGVVDDGLVGTTYYADNDGDGWGDPDNSAYLCEEDSGYVENDLDCDDGDVGEPVIVAKAPLEAGGDTGIDTGETGDSSWDSGWDSGGGWGDGTAANPFSDIQDGIDFSNVCVHVYPGTYWEDIDFGGNSVEVVGVNGSAETTIYGSGQAPVVTIANGETSDATLMGFTIQGGGGLVDSSEANWDCGTSSDCVTTTVIFYGGGIFVDGADATLEDLVVTGNELPEYSYIEISDTEDMYVYSFGGGIYVADGNVDGADVTYSFNAADAGGGSYIGEGGIYTANWHNWDGNWAAAGGGVGSVGDWSATNAVLINNISVDGDGVQGGAALDVADGGAAATNVTMAGNEGLASVYLTGASSTSVLNSIVSDNREGSLYDGEATVTLSVQYSTAYNGPGDLFGSFTDPTGVDGNLDSDPTFVAWTADYDSSNDDLALASGSPAIDAGSPASAYNDVDGSVNDQGAYGGPNGDW